MSANVALSETFDQWRVKTNELLVMTQTDGSPNIIKLTSTTNSTSNTTGSIITAGGVGISKSAVIGENLNVHGNIHANGAITADGNLTLGNADTDSVTVSADFTSHLIPNANNLYDLGSSTKQWADIYATSTNLVVDATGAKSGVVALNINADDADVQAFTIDGEQTTVNVFSIAADAMTTGSALGISDNSADTNEREVVRINQDNAAALEARALYLQSDGGRQGMVIDKNYTDVAAATVTGIHLDFDRTVPGSGTATFTDIGIDLDLNAAGLGTTTSTGLDVDVVGATSGTHTAVGANITVGSADVNYAALFSGGNTGFGVSDPDSTVEILATTRQLKLSYDGTNATGFTVGSGGALTIDSAVTATSFSGALIGGAVTGSTATMTGAVTTTDNMAANTATVLTNAVVTAHGNYGFSLQLAAAPPAPASGKGLLYTKTDGKIYYRGTSGTGTAVAETDLGVAGITASEQNTFTRQQTFDDQALTSATTVSWNANTQQVATLTLGHNATIANATNHSSGGVYIMRVTQAAAPKTLAWSTGYKWPGNTAPTMTATASAVDVFTFVSDGTYMYGSFSGSQNFT